MLRKLMLTAAFVVGVAGVLVVPSQPVSADHGTSGLADQCPDHNGHPGKIDGPAASSSTTINVGGTDVKVNVSADKKSVSFTDTSDNPIVVEFCLKASNNAGGKQVGTAGSVFWTNNGHNTPDISYVVVYSVVDQIPDFCDPSQRPGGQSIGQWLANNQFDGSDCFEYVVNQSCGSLDVRFTKNLTPYAYSFRYALGNQTPALANWAGDGALPVQFAEGEGNGSVDVTYYAVGPEKDYFVGFGIPNIWDGNGETVTVDTDCEEEGGRGGQPVVPADDKPEKEVEEEQVDAPVVAAVDAGAGPAVGSAVLGLFTSLTAVVGVATRKLSAIFES